MLGGPLFCGAREPRRSVSENHCSGSANDDGNECPTRRVFLPGCLGLSVKVRELTNTSGCRFRRG